MYHSHISQTPFAKLEHLIVPRALNICTCADPKGGGQGVQSPIYLSTNTATPPRGDYMHVSGVLQTGRQCSES